MKLKRILLITTIFMLSFSPVAFGMTGSGSNIASKKNLPTLELQKPELNLPERLVNPENPDEKVRIIVELENEPTIEKATEKGVLYKQLKLSEREELEETVQSEQESVQTSINKVVPGIEYIQSFTTIFNGFSAEVEAKFAQKIVAIDGVKAVYESTEYKKPSVEPEMIYSKELVQAQKAWKDYGFKGEGMVVGVIDTGIDPSHKDMKLTNSESGEITKTEVDDFLVENSLSKGKFYTAKVPFGYNYIDENYEVRDLGSDASMHGMHVGGTVAANGDEENGGITGIAPEAQLLALKVFSNNPMFPSTFGDIYVKAIDDSIKLGVDVLNLSLGSTSGYVDANNPEQQAVKRATENGILVSISAGNSDMYGSGYFYPYAENQDYGLTGSPSVSNESLGVASFENSVITAYSFSYKVNDVLTGSALYLLANSADPLKLNQKEYLLEDAGFGNPSDFAGKDFKGKFALVSRGAISFVEKGLNAQAAGAAGVIVYNNAVGTINMASDPAIKIPYMSALKSDGDALKKKLDAGDKVKVNFDGKFMSTQSPTAGEMSSFTSWGPTPNLDFKPEITAPGGNIFSTLNNNKYGLMSGTSMAAPHVAGGAALIFERVDKEFEVTNSERVQLAKNLLMNTATPIEYVPGEYYSPRRQGAGLMQLANALSTDVVVTNEVTGEAKVALKEIENNKIVLELIAKNYSNQEKTYNVDVAVQTDYPITTSGYDVVVPNIVGSNVVTDMVDIDSPENIKIPANSEVPLKVTIDISALSEDDLYDVFSNGYFVDGFVTLSDPTEEVSGNVPLTVPFFGFNGGWDDASIFDYFAWDSMSYWGYTALADELGNFIKGGSFVKGFSPEKFAFSPNGDGIIDNVTPIYSLFRNAKKLEVNILDATDKKVRTIRTANNATKHYISTNPYTYNSGNAWDGKINGKVAKDGQYFIEIRGVIDYPEAKWQSIKFPIIVDTVAPTADVSYDAISKTLTLNNFVDNEAGVGVDRFEVYINDKKIGQESALTKKYEITTPLEKTDKITLKVFDIAGNNKSYDLTAFNEEENGPEITIKSPEYFSYHNTNTIDVEGSVEDEGPVKSVKINGEEAQEFDGVNFKHTTIVEDGFNNVSVEAIDEFDNVTQIQHKIFVDTKAPEITLSDVEDGAKYTMDDPNPVAKLTLKDNFDEVRVYLNGSEVFFKEISEPYGMNGYDETIKVEIPLLIGKNKYEFKVVDLVGNSATTNIELSKFGEALEVNKQNISMKVDNTEQLEVTKSVYTEAGEESHVPVTDEAEYTSYDGEIIEVSENGLITAKASGKTEITVKYEGLTAVVNVEVVEKDIISVKLNKNKLNLNVADTDKLVVTETTTTADGKSTEKDVTNQATFTSNNEEVVTVESGIVTAIGAGETIIAVEYNGEKLGEVTVTVTEKQTPNVITLAVDKTELSLTTGATSQLTVKKVTTPEDGEPTEVDVTEEVSYIVGDDSKVSVVKGLVTAKAKGNTTITIKHGEIEAVVNVTVKDAEGNPGNGGGTPSTPPTPPADPGNVVVDDKKVDEQVKDTKSTRVEVTVPAPTADKPRVNAEVSATALKAIADSGKSFVVKAGETGLSVPSEVIKEISKNGNGKANFEINLDKDAKVPGKGTSVSSVYDFEISVEKDGKTSTVSTFSKPIEVSVPVNASAVKNVDKVAAYYVNEKTNTLEYVGSKYANGKVTFKTNHFSKFVVVENNITFKDLNKSWAKDYIESLASKTIIKGITEDTFGPGAQITRVQFAVLLTRSLNLPTEEYQGVFSDVTKGMTWSVREIEAANRAGIILGSNGKFNPNEKITRQQMASMIIRAIEYNDASVLKGVTSKVTFADEASISDYAKENVALAAELGIISGKKVNGKQVFAPLDYATRAEASKMLYNLLSTF
ncbi:Ig-like domain (group 2) [Psychrobacillus sp. OK028]|nr:Ig-like domain (group 2) [Psychrobacillus sp. OK028]